MPTYYLHSGILCGMNFCWPVCVPVLCMSSYVKLTFCNQKTLFPWGYSKPLSPPSHLPGRSLNLGVIGTSNYYWCLPSFLCSTCWSIEVLCVNCPLLQWFSTLKGLHIRYPLYQLFTLQFITKSKLQLWSSNEMVGDHNSMRNCIKRPRIKKVENYWSPKIRSFSEDGWGIYGYSSQSSWVSLNSLSI